MQLADTRQAISLQHTELKDQDIFDALGLLATGNDEQIKRAAEILAAKGQGLFPDICVTLLLGKNESRRAAAWILGEQRDPAAEPYLLKALDDPDHRVRLAIIYALGQVGSIASIRIFESLPDDGQDELATAMARSVRLITARMAAFSPV